MAEIVQGSLDASVAPSSILFGHLNNYRPNPGHHSESLKYSIVAADWPTPLLLSPGTEKDREKGAFRLS